MPQDLPICCYRCATADMAADGPIDGLCRACRGEVEANRADARDELVRTFYSGHGIGHVYREDVAL